MRPHTLARLAGVAPLALAAACGARAVTVGSPIATAATSTAAYVVTLGSDTLMVESYSRTPTHLVGDIIQRQPTTLLSHYDVTIGSDGMPVRVDMQTRRPDGTPVPNRPRTVSVLYQGDTVVTQMQMDTLIVRKAVARGAFPYLTGSFALYQLPLAKLRAAGSDSGTIAFLGIGAPQVSPFPVKFVGTDSARVYYFGSPQLVRLASTGEVLGVNAEPTTFKVKATRVAAVDMTTLAREFAARDAAGKGLGAMPSPRDTVNADIAGAHVWVDYGRPALRGRDVWANGVLGDTIWRTGANAATQLRTDKALVIAGQTIPAGMYTIWTRAVGGSYALIFNKQVGQWGTEYHADRDLVRVPLAVTTLPSPVDRFTIAVVPQASGGAIQLQWGTRQLLVPFTVK